ncbi:class I SAM-dependent methyltransferase [Hyphomicrobium sp.]|uniref:class I SAM-dependent methyltransferase n=1 Tax=Hyphomicrobium sp. TaxID=82 RepID=UPI002D0EBAC0|nr:SAM-dependent methyltransferase [Hyphomicrobium sp.]HVZ03535.1 SAM-dependent methyltransferase [Hyphomicrobium sp.]
MIDDPKTHRDTPLARQIKESIRRDGPMTVQSYMARCLWDDPHGYYRRQRVFGATGDFITAAEISQIFGELIGIWAGVVWRNVFGAPGAVTFAEYGPGRGTMMRDALRAARVVPGFSEAVRPYLIEASPTLAGLQSETLADFRGKITWGSKLDEFAPPAIIVANEFLDSWPVAQWIKTGDGWRIRGVSLDPAGELQFDTLDGDCPHEAFDALLPDAPPGAVVETQRLDRLATALQSLMQRGPVVMLLIDYGHTIAAAGDTLQAVRAHQYESPLASPGEADLTVHVNFYDLASTLHRAGLALDGPVMQSEFLGAVGIVERTSRLMAANPQRAGEIETSVARLLAPSGMGSRFKVLAARSPDLPPLPGFRAAVPANGSSGQT